MRHARRRDRGIAIAFRCAALAGRRSLLRRRHVRLCDHDREMVQHISGGAQLFDKPPAVVIDTAHRVRAVWLELKVKAIARETHPDADGAESLWLELQVQHPRRGQRL